MEVSTGVKYYTYDYEGNDFLGAQTEATWVLRVNNI